MIGQVAVAKESQSLERARWHSYKRASLHTYDRNTRLTHMSSTAHTPAVVIFHLARAGSCRRVLAAAAASRIGGSRRDSQLSCDSASEADSRPPSHARAVGGACVVDGWYRMAGQSMRLSARASGSQLILVQLVHVQSDKEERAGLINPQRSTRSMLYHLCMFAVCFICMPTISFSRRGAARMRAWRVGLAGWPTRRVSTALSGVPQWS